MADKPRSPRDLLSLGLLILVALSLVFAASQLLRGAAHVLPVPPLDLTPEPGEETVDPQQPDISTDDLRELSLAVAAVITALTGLLGLVLSLIHISDSGRLDRIDRASARRLRLRPGDG